MASKDLSNRAIWQDESGRKAGMAESDFYEVFKEYFNGTDFVIIDKPKELKKIYVNVELDSQELSEIFTPDEEIKTHGISPDYAIHNTKTDKTIYIEVKRQDGWVEGKKRSAGRGNAHERACKYFTPGLLKTLRKTGNISTEHLPFWTIFQGDITRDPCRVREVKLWYGEYKSHYFMWRNSQNKQPIIDCFEKNIKHILD